VLASDLFEGCEMKMGKIVVQGLLFLVFLSVLLPGAAAQYRASIQGVVTDPDGSAIIGATVTLQNEETNQTLTATTNEEGIYNFSSLPPSHFTLTVEKAGFKKKVLKGVGVIAEQANSVAVQLEIGQASETVTVDGDAAPLIDTETANLSGTVNAQEIQKLPSFGRDVFQLLQLAPGAFGDGAQGSGGGTQNLPGTTIGGTSSTDGIFKTENGGQIVANGARTGENNYQIDGVGTTSVSWGGTSVITPNEDAVKEVKIVTNNYDAENGRYRGAQIQLITQNGTNQYHGSLFLKADRPGLNAFQKYNGPGNPLTKNDSRFNDYGGTVGGPILRNKLFAFFSYETLRAKTAGGNASGWYETSQLRALAIAGSNAAAIVNFPGAGPAPGTVLEGSGDQHTCSDIGLVEGVNCMFIVGQGLDLGRPLNASAFPLGTADPSWLSNTSPGLGGDGTGSTANFDGVADIQFVQNSSPSSSTAAQYNGRLDFNATSKDLIFFSIYWVPQSATSFNGANRPVNLFNHTQTNSAFTAGWSHTFSPTLLNEVRANAAGWRWQDLKNNPQAAWGLANENFSTAFGAQSIGTISPEAFGIGAPGTFDQWTYAAKDVLTKVHGTHTMKFGGEVTKLQFADVSPWSARPSYSFNNFWDFLNDAPQGETATFNPITGVPTDFRKDTRSTLVGIFAQDNWKVKPNLTLTFGMRWEYFGPISEKNGHLSSVRLGTGPDLLTGMKLQVGGTLYNPSTNNFGPQLGFAWSPHHLMSHEFGDKLVVRGGFGISYNGLDEAISLNGRSNPPFLSAAGVLTGNQVLYQGSFPADPHSFGGYASNPATIENFDPTTNLPLAGPNFAPVDVTGYPSDWPTTTSYHYSLETAYDLGHRWVVTLGYQGNQTRHLTRQYNLNIVAGVQGIAFNPVVPHVDWYANDGTSNFNAFLAEAHHEFTRSFELDAQYRWSKSMDTGSNNFANGQYQYNLATDYGPSDFDIKHAFKLWGIWSPTLFRGSHNWAEKILGGWALSGILNAHTGFPWTPVINDGCDALYQGSAGGGGTCALRPAAYLGGAGSDYSNSAFIKPGGNFPNGPAAYFTFPTVVTGPSFADVIAGAPLGPVPTAPGIGRNSFRGPRYFDVDATLSKAFGLPSMKVLGENAKIEFRANFYNLFNKLNLTNVDTNLQDTAHFGQALNGLGGRMIEMQARFSF
jgi:hypothetical protein